MPNIVSENQCPSWCIDHNGSAHRTEDRTVPPFGGDVTLRVFQFGDNEERLQIGREAYTLGQASDIARHVLRLLSEVESPDTARALNRGDITAAAEHLLARLETGVVR